MKLTVFQSADGDCLLLESGDGKRMLIDGGRSASYRAHAASVLATLPVLDVLCVSHIDEDHIGGVLTLMDDAFAWRVHEKHPPGDGHRPPSEPKPPPVHDLWHNGFGDQLGGNARKIADVLVASAGRLDFGAEPWEAARYRLLATSVPQGIELSERVDQLEFPHNQAFGGKLALVRDGAAPPLRLGSVDLTVIGPFERDLDILRGKWEAWLRSHEDDVRKLRERMREDVASLSNGDVQGFRSALAAQADDLGNRKKVTAPNLASLMLFAREGGKTVLLTGDGHADDILRGLDHAGVAGDIHVNVLKVQHHGAEFNMTPDFSRRVKADHYVFCGNGAHENPDVRVLKLILDNRAGGDKFKFWFNCPPVGTQMTKVRNLVTASARPGFTFEFLDAKKSFFELKL
jgi:hypothetical protein